MKVLAVMNGKFGSKVLKPKYRRIWKMFTLATSMIVIGFTLIILDQWWSGVVKFLNYVIWGV